MKSKTLLIFLLFFMSLQINAQKQVEKINEFTGDLESGKRYFAKIKFNEILNEWVTIKPLKLPFHHAGKIEWINLKNFAVLQNQKGKECRQIVFKIISKKIYQADKRRWNTILRAKILYLIPDKYC